MFAEAEKACEAMLAHMPFGSYTNSFKAMRALFDRLNEDPSVKLTPTRPSAPVATTSPR